MFSELLLSYLDCLIKEREGKKERRRCGIKGRKVEEERKIGEEKGKRKLFLLELGIVCVK